MTLRISDKYFIMTTTDVGSILALKQKIAQQAKIFLGTLRETLLVKIL